MEFNRFDVSAKELIWDDPSAWLERLGHHPAGPVEVIDSDITTLSASADKVIRVDGEKPYLVNIELQSSHETTLVRTLWYRQVALDYRHELPVLTVLILLRKEANSPALTGVYERVLPDGWMMNRYNYEVVRLWREEPESFLTAGVGLVPLAPLADVSERDLPGLIARMADRINREPRFRADKLWTSTYLLMGLRFSDELIDSLLEGVQSMQESTTYQKILREGRLEGRIEGQVLEARRMVIRAGSVRFGEPEVATVNAIGVIQDLERLEALQIRILDVNVRGWDELLNDGVC